MNKGTIHHVGQQWTDRLDTFRGGNYFNGAVRTMRQQAEQNSEVKEQNAQANDQKSEPKQQSSQVKDQSSEVKELSPQAKQP